MRMVTALRERLRDDGRERHEQDCKQSEHEADLPVKAAAHIGLDS